MKQDVVIPSPGVSFAVLLHLSRGVQDLGLKRDFISNWMILWERPQQRFRPAGE